MLILWSCASFGLLSGFAQDPILFPGSIRAPLAADLEVFLNHFLSERSVLVAAGFIRKTEFQSRI